MKSYSMYMGKILYKINGYVFMITTDQSEIYYEDDYCIHADIYKIGLVNNISDTLPNVIINKDFILNDNHCGYGFTFNNKSYYFKNRLIHREDGPTIEDYAENYFEWWLDGEKCIFEQWCSKLNKSEEEIAFLRLKYNI